MDPGDVFRFDLQGYVILRGVLSPAEVAAANSAVDAHLPEFAGLESAQDMLGWRDRAPFVRMLAHPRLVPYLNCICGPGFRMDHAPTMICQSKGDDTQLGLHGSSGPGFDPKQYYIWRNGQMHNGLVVVTWQLNDQLPGDGGFCYVPGTHKSNLRGPQELYSHESHKDLVRQEPTSSGDCIIFTEALTHGTLPWGRADYARRSVLFRYSPANLAFAGGRHDFDREHRAGNAWPSSWYEGLADRQRAVLEPPYSPGAQRPILGDDGELLPQSKEQLAAHGWDGIGNQNRTVTSNPPKPARQQPRL